VLQTDAFNGSLIQSFTRLIAEQTGLDIKAHEQTTLSAKIALRIKALRLTTPQDYYLLLANKSIESWQEWQILVSLITNSESYFFRDKGQFALLTNHILPELIQKQRHHKTLRICSAGCSTGEEPYSLAILLKELIPDIAKWSVLVLGIDINSVALEKAEAGVYRNWSFRGTSLEIQQRYFKYSQDHYHLHPQIKQMVKFQSCNLVKDQFPQLHSELRDMNLIVCRNVFIYFEENAIAKVLDKFYQTLQPFGYLLTGHAELHAQDLGQFQTKVFSESLIYQRPNHSAVASSRIKPLPPPSFVAAKPTEPDRSTTAPVAIPAPSTPSAPVSETELLRRAELLVQQKAYHLAIAQIKQALKHYPRNAKAYELVAQIAAIKGEDETVVRYCKQALKIDSFAISPQYLLAKVAQKRGDLAEAKRIFKRIIYLEPASVAAYFELSKLYQAEADQERATKMQQTALTVLSQLSPNTVVPELNHVTVEQLIFTLATQLNKHSL
jgi:chemotaxis protein methyltransferase CheR